MDIRFRSLDTWPYEATHPGARRSRRTFKAPWSDTLQKLQKEINHLNGRDIVIECFLAPGDIRMDGWPRSNAREPLHPGVAVHFESDKGHLRYATDVHSFWQHNVRAIALGLEALRKVDLYGITRGGEQYRGFAALPGAIAVRAIPMTRAEAAEFIWKAGNVAELYDLDDIDEGTRLGPWAKDAYRRAAHALHPDTGGSAEAFQKLQEARQVLGIE